ncbi:class I SAM-dependent methyltransferase [Cerasicoccus arenae]|uniref:Methyltransferase type 11 domain-containing protein n=1 Tax=Cerasicoccus arenae TaxID=424488 RepID=A0A8J3DEZ1_9BACT|nr:class I SAM-dependent methyltransferase [Cerasicoccus arenae]MBK1858701.1 class I SAM-dependent methyltransferase [Cerasicoccus arenae]GHB98396.1 hypothetical protein GCM10007047_13120 [Cerasicoccus arenae]
MSVPDYSSTVERFTGFGEAYNQARPSAPTALADLLCPIAGCDRPDLVVDLGCGTGLSTRYWAERAKAVIGVEPTASMREQAVQAGGANITYRTGYSHETGLPAVSADLVLCAQSLHWMEPFATFAEAARILRTGGIFAAYDYDWPPFTSSWEVDAAYIACMEHGRQLERECGLTEQLPRWDKPGHLERMRKSGQFRFVRESLLHHEDEGGAARIVALLLSQGYIQSLLKQGLTERDLHIDHLRDVAAFAFGDGVKPWLWSVRVRLGVK